MSDEQQATLDGIVRWMYEVADPWMRDGLYSRPQPGSDLANDDAVPPENSMIAHRAILMGLDHLGGVVDAAAAGPPRRLNAYFTALRTALLCGTRALWLLQPDEPDQRRLRAIRYRFENLEEQRKAIQDLEGTHLVGETEESRQQALATIRTHKAALTEYASALGVENLAAPPDTVSMLRSLVDTNTLAGASFIQLWRTGSASAHGHYWSDEMRDNPGAFDHVSFQPAIQSAVLMLSDAMTLYTQRSTPPA
ncbi:hypothetical protein ACJH6H_26545 [Mycobacterium sp. SMC-21]|uniref:hypothetical protein n=1 Tax=Mycobacterium sp. SMC-21 TaxID=3381632 RepID=UPI0038760C9D